MHRIVLISITELFIKQNISDMTVTNLCFVHVTSIRLDEVRVVVLTEKFIDSAAAIFFDWTARIIVLNCLSLKCLMSALP